MTEHDHTVGSGLDLGRTPISRRRMLGLLAAGGGTLVIGVGPGDLGPLRGIGLLDGLLGPLLGDPSPVAPPASILLARPDDGLFLALSFVNLDIQPRNSGPDQLVLRNSAQPGYVVFGLSSQSLFEQAVFDQGTGITPPTQPVPAVMSGPSRLVLKVSPGAAPVDYNLGSLLDLAAFDLATSPIADNGSGSALPTAPPGPTHTAIEAPWRLLLSPPGSAAFSAEQAPVTRNGRTELWHARAVGRGPDGGADQRPLPVPIRAIWALDLAQCGGASGFPLADTLTTGVALTPEQRLKLVAATTTTKLPELGTAAPADASLLLVSPMGASLDVHGAWPERNDVVAWRHRSYLGRDNYVKVEEPGFLFPFGFRAVKVSITDRILGGGLAFLRKREFIVVRQPTVDFPGVGQPKDGRKLPFGSVTTTTLVSPPLAAMSDPIGAGEWVRVAGPSGDEDLRYQLILTGQDGNTVHADLPLVFVPAAKIAVACGAPGKLGDVEITNPAYDSAAGGTMDTIIDLYHGSGTDVGDRRTLRLAGQKLGFVPRHTPGPDEPAAEETAVPTFDLVLRAELSTASQTVLLAARQLAAFPLMDTAQVHLEAVDAVGGGQSGLPVITLNDAYTDHGFAAANPNEVWASIESGAPSLSVPQQTAGGMATPALDIEGLSRGHGPVSDLAGIVAGDFTPANYFPLDTVTLLGGIPLKDVIAPIGSIPSPRGPEGDNVPKVVTTRTDDAIRTVVRWRPTLQPSPDPVEGLFDPAPPGDPDRRMDLEAVFHTDLGTAATTTLVTGDLRNFDLNFVGQGELAFIRQHVNRLHFESRNGAKPTLDIQLGNTEFLGDLRFLAELQQYLPALPGGIKIDVTPSGVAAGLTIAIPAVALGVVLIQNLSIGVLLDLPFNGNQATLTFNFATREHPFQVTISALGGGGFLAIGMGTRGVQKIEGALEFGAAVAVDLGVASGSLSIMAGIYFKFAQRLDSTGQPALPPGNTVVITGYVRATGELEVLGLIHASLEFYLGLTYTDDGGSKRVEGEATLTVRVDVAVFSAEVSVSMHKEFGGGPDPSFGDQITAGDWSGYCAAFAA